MPTKTDSQGPQRRSVMGRSMTNSRSISKKHKVEDSYSETSNDEMDDDDDTRDRRKINADLPSEYWQIQKLIKYLKGGNPTATLIALCSLRDFDLSQDICQIAIRDVDGLEALVNLLDTSEIKCQIASLKILKDISQSRPISRSLTDLGAIQSLIGLLSSSVAALQCLAAETIANIAKLTRARRLVRKDGGIGKFVSLLAIPANTNIETLKEDQQAVELLRCAALGLCSLSKSKKNKRKMKSSGLIQHLSKLITLEVETILVPVVATLSECSVDPEYRAAICEGGIIQYLSKFLESENWELVSHCAKAIFHCAEDVLCRTLIRQHYGLEPLVRLIKFTENVYMLEGVTGAIWKVAIDKENCETFKDLKLCESLVPLLHNQPEEVMINVAGSIAECAKIPENIEQIRKSGGLTHLVNLLSGTNPTLLINVAHALGKCATEPDSATIIDKYDGVRLLWSLLKSPNPQVQSSAAWAICPCIDNNKDAGEMVRSLVGGLELIVSLLKSDNREVLASICSSVANIAKDEQNLAVLTDHGVVPILSKLVVAHANDDYVRGHIADAIGRCCIWGNNRKEFGAREVVKPLVKYLKSKDTFVFKAAAMALFNLSLEPENCVVMHENHAKQWLVNMVGDDDWTLQEAAAGCIANIRHLALANDIHRSQS